MESFSMVSNLRRVIFYFILFLLANLYLLNPSMASEGGQKLKDVYVIGPEDIIEVSAWKNADISREVTVRPDGMISLPLIGDLQAAGLTPDMLRKAIVDKLKDYQENAVVSVLVKDINSYKVFVLGEVVKPGEFKLKSRTSVLQAIALAGGFTQFASKNKIMLIRTSAGGNKDEKIRVSFNELVHSETSDKNLILKSGDTIFVP